MNGRNFLDLALLVPGASPTNIGSTQLFAETSAVPGQGLSIASQRNLSNNFIVDGLSANDDAAGLSGMTYGVDAVEQFQVVTSGGQAELGRALGGYINVVTKSGTNTLRGTLYDFIRDDSFNAPNALSGTTLPMDQHQFGGSLGGPLARNRTFFFSNFEQRLLDQTGLVTILPENVTAINARLADTGYPGSSVTTGIYPNPVHSANVLGKLDHHVSGSDHLTIRYSLYRVTSDNSRGAGALNAPTASAGLDNVDHALGFGNTWTLSPRTVNETRAQFAYSDLNAPPTDVIGPAVSIAGVASFGTSSGSPTHRLTTMYQVVNTLSHQAGAHALRAGVDVVFNDTTITYPRSSRGNYSFASLPNFLSSNYSGFTQTFGDPVVSQSNPNIGMYAQDEWRVGSKLTLNLGLRYDLQFLEPVNTDTNNVSPRVGFAWSPSTLQDLIVRGSAGLFFDRVPLRAVANAILSAGNTTDLSRLHQPSVSGLIPTQAGAPTFPNILPAHILTTTLVDFTTMDRSLQNAYSKQASLEVERVIAQGLTASVAYQYLRGDNLLMSVNQNVPTCVAAGTNNGCRPNSTYRNNNQYSSVAESTYHGLHLSLVQRPTTWSSLRVTYTLSKSMNNVGEAFFSSPVDPTDIMRDWGRSDDDQRHRMVINGTVSTPTTPATTAWQHVSHGFQFEWLPAVLLVPSVQHHVGSREPARHDQSAACEWGNDCAELRRAGGDPDFKERRGRRRFLQPESSTESGVSNHRRRPDRGSARSVQRDESCERTDAERDLRAGVVSDKSGLHVQPGHGCRRAENLSVWSAPDVLKRDFSMNLSKASSLALAIALMASALSGRAAIGAVDIGVKDRTNAYTSLATSGKVAVLVWGASTKEGLTDVYVASSHDGGLTFGVPTRVNRVAGDANFSGEQPPRVVLLSRAGQMPAIVVVWTAKAPVGTRLLSGALRRWREIVHLRCSRARERRIGQQRLGIDRDHRRRRSRLGMARSSRVGDWSHGIRVDESRRAPASGFRAEAGRRCRSSAALQTDVCQTGRA